METGEREGREGWRLGREKIEDGDGREREDKAERWR